MAGMEIPIKAIREYIENAIDIVIQTSRLADGRRKITSICEVVGFEKDNIKLKEIFGFKQKGLTEKGEVIGEFIKHNYKPQVYSKLKSRGIDNLKDIFE
jgi:pilus assembly protein CpaF